MRNFLFLLVFTVLVSGCTSVPSVTQRVNVDFKGYVYNDITNQYVPQMTWAKISSHDEDGKVELVEVRVDRYGSGSNFLYIDLDNIDRHISAVDKYLKWEILANKNKELVDKKIDGIPSKYLGYDIEYSFFSGNTDGHYLSVDNATSFVTRGAYAIYFDRENAMKYKEMLVKFKNGEYQLSGTIYQ